MKLEEQVLSIEQVKHLQELGLDMSDAALCWAVGETAFQDMTIKHQSVVSTDSKPQRYPFIKEIIPTYTLQEILGKLPKEIKVGGEEYELMHITDEKIGYATATYGYDWDDKPYGILDFFVCFNSGNNLDDAYDLLYWAIANGYLKND